MDVAVVVSCMVAGLTGVLVASELVRDRVALPRDAPASTTSRWLLRLEGWQHHPDGLHKRYRCDSPTHAHLLLGRFATAVASPDEFTRLRVTVHGAGVHVRIHAPLATGQHHLTRTDARLAGRIDRLDKAFHCPLVEPRTKAPRPPLPRTRS